MQVSLVSLAHPALVEIPDSQELQADQVQMGSLDRWAWQVYLGLMETPAYKDLKARWALLDPRVRKVKQAFLVSLEPQDLLGLKESRVSKDSVEKLECQVKVEILDDLG